MERELSVTIEVNDDGSGSISVYDHSSSCGKDFTVSKNTNCNDADELAKEIGYELLSWIDIERENMTENAE